MPSIDEVLNYLKSGTLAHRRSMALFNLRHSFFAVEERIINICQILLKKSHRRILANYKKDGNVKGSIFLITLIT
jgi:hypothetical protein